MKFKVLLQQTGFVSVTIFDAHQSSSLASSVTNEQPTPQPIGPTVGVEVVGEHVKDFAHTRCGDHKCICLNFVEYRHENLLARFDQRRSVEKH